MKGTGRTLRRAFVGVNAALALSNIQRSQCTAAAARNSCDITFFQYKICPFCHRVRAYMDYNSIPYTTVEVNPLTKKQIAFSSDHKKVPIANINGNTVFNSADIIDKLKEFSSAEDSKKLFTADTEEWMKWSETKLAVLLYPNITRSFGESWDAFSYVSDVSSWNWLDRSSNRILGPLAMSFANSKIKAKYNIWDERKELKELLVHWTDSIATNNKGVMNGNFLHGAHVTMPDLMVYGVLHSIEGLETFDTIMTENTALKSWYDNVQQAVKSDRACT